MAQRTEQLPSSMAGSGVSGSSSSSTPSHQAVPKILLAKPGLVSAGKFNRGSGGGGGTDDDSVLRTRLPSIGSVNLLSESWDFNIDRFLPFLTDNTDFTVVGVIGPPGVGKSTIMNEIYGFDATSPGMLPPFSIQSEETRAMAKHCTVGIEPRISSERIILLDTQPVFSASILSEIMKPDGSSAISVITGESLSAELAYELMNIQLGILLASICHIVLVVSEGVHDAGMWNLMSTVDLLKHNIPDPSSVTLSHPQGSGLGPEKEKKDTILDAGKEYMASPVFVHTKLCTRDIAPHSVVQLNRALGKYFSSASFMRSKIEQNASRESISSPAIMTENTQSNDLDSALPMLFLIPSESGDDSSKPQYESYICALWRLRDQVLSMSNPSFSRTVSERDWLKNSAKIWDIIKTSPTVTDYYRTLHASGMFRR